MKPKLRQVEIMVAGAGWTKCKFSDVFEGDQFRLFESTGEPVIDNNGQTEFVAIKDAYISRDTNQWCIETPDEEV